MGEVIIKLKKISRKWAHSDCFVKYLKFLVHLNKNKIRTCSRYTMDGLYKNGLCDCGTVFKTQACPCWCVYV